MINATWNWKHYVEKNLNKKSWNHFLEFLLFDSADNYKEEAISLICKKGIKILASTVFDKLQNFTDWLLFFKKLSDYWCTTTDLNTLDWNALKTISSRHWVLYTEFGITTKTGHQNVKINTFNFQDPAMGLFLSLWTLQLNKHNFDIGEVWTKLEPVSFSYNNDSLKVFIIQHVTAMIFWRFP